MSRELEKLNRVVHTTSFSASGGMATAATTTFKRLASLADIGKATAGLQQNHCMEQMPAQLFIGQNFSDVPQRSTILLPLPSETRL